jgi:O-antigen ligase
MMNETTKKERARRLLERAIFAGLVAVTTLAVVPYGSVDPWWEGIFEAAVFALGALWMVEGALGGGGWFVAAHRVLLPLVVLLLFAVGQTFSYGVVRVAGVATRATLSADPFETVRFVLKLASLMLLAALWLRYTSSPRRLRALVLTVVGVGVASALFGIARQMMQTEDTLRLISPRLAANRDGYAQFINRNHFAFLAEMSLGAAMGLLVGSFKRRERLPLYVASALVVWAGIVMSNSRGGIVGMFVALAVVALLYFAYVRRTGETIEVHGGEAVRASQGAAAAGRSLVARVALAVGVLLLVSAGVLWVGGERLAERLETVATEVGARDAKVRWGDRRVEIWGATWALIRAHPLTGAGFGAYRAAITGHHDASGEMSLEQAHNDYLELAASGGVIGVALFAWFVFAFVRRARTGLGSHDFFRRAVCAGALGGLCAVAVHSLFDFGLHVTANASVLSALVAVAAVDGRVERRDGERVRRRRDARRL